MHPLVHNVSVKSISFHTNIYIQNKETNIKPLSFRISNAIIHSKSSIHFPFLSFLQNLYKSYEICMNFHIECFFVQYYVMIYLCSNALDKRILTKTRGQVVINIFFCKYYIIIHFRSVLDSFCVDIL